MSRPGPRLALVALAASACTCSDRDDAPGTAASIDRAPASGQPATSAPEPPAAAPLMLPDGCYSGLEPSDPGLLAALIEQCAPGTTDLSEAASLARVSPGESRDVSFPVDEPPKCIRAFAVATEPVDDVIVSVLSPSGETLAKDDLTAPFSLVPRSGPLCVGEGGTYRVRVATVRNSSPIEVRVRSAE